MRKWIYGKIRKYVSDTALDFTVRWGECRSMMEESVKREEGIVKYGMLGIMATVMMMFAVLGNVLEILVLLLMVCGGLFAFVEACSRSLCGSAFSLYILYGRQLRQ